MNGLFLIIFELEFYANLFSYLDTKYRKLGEANEMSKDRMPKCGSVRMIQKADNWEKRTKCPKKTEFQNAEAKEWHKMPTTKILFGTPFGRRSSVVKAIASDLMTASSQQMEKHFLLKMAKINNNYKRKE